MGYGYGYDGWGMMDGYEHGGALVCFVTLVLVWGFLVLGSMALWKYIRGGEDKKDK